MEIKVKILVFLSCLIVPFLSKTQNNETAFIAWQNLKNPVYQHANWSTKDVCMEYKDGIFYLFFSAFYFEREKERSHVVGVSTKDWINFSEPFLHIDGKEGGWTGMCSPNLSKIGNQYVLTFNSWGKRHPNKGTNDLFFIRSTDLLSWSKPERFDSTLTYNKTSIDAALAHANNKYYLFWKDDYLEGATVRYKKIRLAICDSLNGKYNFLGDGLPKLYFKGEKEPTSRYAENFQFTQIDSVWYCYVDFEQGEQYLFRMKGNPAQDESWLCWEEFTKLEVPKESYSTQVPNYSGAINDWRKYDGYFYMVYAGRTENSSHLGRGDNKIGIARSKDLINWKLPPKQQ